MSTEIKSQNGDTVIVAFTCVNLKIQIHNRYDYIKNICEEINKRGLVENIIIEPDGDSNYFILKFFHLYQSPTINEGDNFYITFSFGTYDSGIQLDVSIITFAGYLCKERDFVEQLKFCIKDYLIRDWERVEWLVDKDSELLSVDVYPLIFQTENLIRQMISELFGRKYGAAWWDLFIPISIKEKHKSRLSGYKKTVPGFANIDERLLSIDIGDLLNIITLKVLKWNPEYDDHLNDMLSGMNTWKEEEVRKLLERQMVVEKNLWEDLFKQYLPEGFLEKLKVFDLDRNHIAHNKLIDRQAHSAIRNNTIVVRDALEKAIDKIRKNVLSSELMSIQIREEEEEKAYLDATYEYIKELEAGVEIRDAEEIIDVFYEATNTIGDMLEEALRFRQDIEIDKEDQNKLVVLYRINNESIVFDIATCVDSSQGAESTTTISDDKGFEVDLTYINGEVEYDEEQANYKPLKKDKLPDVDTVVDELTEYINKRFSNLRRKVDQEKYRIIKDGGNSPVIDYIPCDECGEFYIAADDSYAEKGTCLNCGYKHELHECIRCGNYFTGSMLVDDIELCDNCNNYYDKE